MVDNNVIGETVAAGDVEVRCSTYEREKSELIQQLTGKNCRIAFDLKCVIKYIVT